MDGESDISGDGWFPLTSILPSLGNVGGFHIPASHSLRCDPVTK